MQAPGLAVPRREAERVRRALVEAGWLRGDLVPGRQEETVVFPLQASSADAPLPPGITGERVVHEFAEQPPKRPRDYRDLVSVEPSQRSLLPSSFDVIGDIVLVRVPRGLEGAAPSIGAALLHFVPGCRRVGWDRGVHGTARTRTLVPLAGEGSWVTLHRENGLTFRVDVENAYFSPRLAHEHERVAALAAPGERLLDLFCGLGPFALTSLARHPGLRAVAVDHNPRAIALLRENADRAAVASRLEVVEGTAEDYLARDERFERVVMNLPREGYKYVTSVASHVMPAGTLHHYEIVERSDVQQRASDLLRELAAGSQAVWKLEPPHVVHPYSPQSDLYAFTGHREA